MSHCLRCRARRRAQRDTTAYDDPRWRACARAFLRVHPACMARDCARPATEVHHIDGRGPTGPRGLDWTNLRALCKSHHSQITGRTVGYGARRT